MYVCGGVSCNVGVRKKGGGKTMEKGRAEGSGRKPPARHECERIKIASSQVVAPAAALLCERHRPSHCHCCCCCCCCCCHCERLDCAATDPVRGPPLSHPLLHLAAAAAAAAAAAVGWPIGGLHFGTTPCLCVYVYV